MREVEPTHSRRQPSFPAGDGRRIVINIPDVRTLMEHIDKHFQAGRGFTLATLNLDHLVKLRRNSAFRHAYFEADFVVADGNPVVWLARLAGTPVSLVPGSDLVEPLCAAAARAGVPVAFYGSDDATLARAAARLEAAHAGLRIVFRRAPTKGFDPEGDQAETDIAAIGASGAGLCLLALGAPRQECFAARAHAILSGCGMVSIGAGLDFVADRQHRAPQWVRRLALEWLWRLLMEPRRLAGRYAACALIVPGLALDALGQRRGRAVP
jgi:exopolysaccharide biosynthesis WecB/TagA/CpsF family protein